MSKDSSFKSQVLWPTVVLLITPVAAAIASKIAGGEWTTWLRRVPPWGYAVFAAACAVWMIVALIIRRRRQLSRRYRSPFHFISVPAAGYVTLGTREAFGVHWRVRLPRDGMFSERPVADADAVDVQTPPLCPKCETELEEHARFFGGVTWTCVGCDHRVKSPESMYTQVFRVERMVKPELRRQINQALGRDQ